jgi:hypothetical protein
MVATPQSSVLANLGTLSVKLDVTAMRSLLLATLFFSGACAERRTCYEGDFIACTCDDGRAGFAACDVAADEHSACGSCGEVPGAPFTSSGGAGGSGGSGGAGGAGGSALLGFLETCTKDEECETGLCHTFNAKGPKCSQPCQADADCPPPSPGCNMMGICKAP